MRIIPYNQACQTDWDAIVPRCPMATFLHSRRFLSYHGDRFRDASAIIKDGGTIVGLFPAAADPGDPRVVSSHPGITYGGVLHQGELYGERMIEALRALMGFYAGRDFEFLRYKVVPKIYQQKPSEDDLYALFRLGAERIRCDLACAIDLSLNHQPSTRRKRGLKNARKQGVVVAEGVELIDALWQVLEENLRRKLDESPVHACDEISQLHALFPENIKFVAGLLNEAVVAGVVLFSTCSVTRAQYIASSVAGNAVSALDAVLDHAISGARMSGQRYFDFGTSNRNSGRELSHGVYDFKIGFGAGGVAQEFYEIKLLPEKSS